MKVGSSDAKKSINNMSNDDLNKAIDRMRLEKTYNDMKASAEPKKDHAVRDFISKSLKDFASSLTSKSINALSELLVNKMFKGNDDPDPMDPKVLEKIKNTLGPQFKDVDESELRSIVSMAKNLKTFKSFLNGDTDTSKDDGSGDN